MSSRLHIYEEQNIEELTLERNKFESVFNEHCKWRCSV